MLRRLVHGHWSAGSSWQGTAAQLRALPAAPSASPSPEPDVGVGTGMSSLCNGSPSSLGFMVLRDRRELQFFLVGSSWSLPSLLLMEHFILTDCQPR